MAKELLQESEAAADEAEKKHDILLITKSNVLRKAAKEKHTESEACAQELMNLKSQITSE
jgi:hypothetical protein